MKVLLTTHVFLPDHGAGTEILTLSVAKELQRLGHEVEICTGFLSRTGQRPSRQSDSYEYAGIKVNRFFHDAAPLDGQLNAVEAEYNNPVFAAWFRQYLARFKPDLMHFFHLWLLSASAIDVCHELNIPMVMTPTDFWLICPNNQLRLPDNSPCAGPDRNSVNCIKHAVSSAQPPYVSRIFNLLPNRVVAAMIGLLDRGAFSGAWFSPMVRDLHRRAGFLRQRMNMLDRVIVPSRLMERMLVNNGLRPEKVVFSPFGISSIAPGERPSHDATGKLRVGFIGGLSEHKGAHVLISAVRSLPPHVPLELKIYGRSTDFPKYFEKLQMLAEEDPRIHFCGTFPNDTIGEIFAGLDVLVVPSIWHENTPLVIYSAQASGCPVIASDLEGMAEVVEHERNGLLFEPGNIAELGRAIERLAQHPDMLHRLATNATKPKQISEYVEELQDIYIDVQQSPRSRASGIS